MTYHRGFFSSPDAAEAALAACVTRETDKLKAASGTTPQTATPATGMVILATEPLPAGACATPMSRVTWQVTAPDGRVERMQSVMPTAQCPPSVVAQGTAKLTATTYPTLRVKASLPSRFQFQTLGATGSITVGSELIDERTGKRYVTTSLIISISGAGFYNTSCDEADSSEVGELTNGTPLKWTAPIANMVPYAQVSRMKDISVDDGTSLVDPANGKQYVTVGAVSGTSIDKLAGETTATASFKRVVGDGVADSASVDPGVTLEFVSPPVGLALDTIVLTKAEVTVPAGTQLSFAGKTYGVTSSAVIHDTMQATLGFLAAVTGPASNIAVAATMTLPTPPSGVSGTATVVTSQLASAFPLAYASQPFGAEVEFESFEGAESDGRFSVRVNTIPIGT